MILRGLGVRPLWGWKNEVSLVLPIFLKDSFLPDKSQFFFHNLDGIVFLPFLSRQLQDSLRMSPCQDVVYTYFLFSPLVGEDSHFDLYFSDGLKPLPSLWWAPFFKLSLMISTFSHSPSPLPGRIGTRWDYVPRTVGWWWWKSLGFRKKKTWLNFVRGLHFEGRL